MLNAERSRQIGTDLLPVARSSLVEVRVRNRGLVGDGSSIRTSPGLCGCSGSHCAGWL